LLCQIAEPVLYSFLLMFFILADVFSLFGINKFNVYGSVLYNNNIIITINL
jgi:hypothetical protein